MHSRKLETLVLQTSEVVGYACPQHPLQVMLACMTHIYLTYTTAVLPCKPLEPDVADGLLAGCSQLPEPWPMLKRILLYRVA